MHFFIHRLQETCIFQLAGSFRNSTIATGTTKKQRISYAKYKTSHLILFLEVLFTMILILMSCQVFQGVLRPIRSFP